MPATSRRVSPRLSKAEYRLLAAFRYHLRRFLRFSEEAAQAAGLTPRQYQALLAIKGFPQRERVTIGELAEQLQIVHHAAVELVDRLSAQKLVERQNDHEDRRKVFVKLSRTGSKILEKLSAAHRQELRRLGPHILALLENLILDGGAKGGGVADKSLAT
jgi:DNA-binding MarR family transcriptional regulator